MSWVRLGHFLAILTWFACSAGTAANGAIFLVRWNTNSGQPIVEVSGLSPKALRKLRAPNWQVEEWQKILSVYAGQAESTASADLPAMLGTYSAKDGLIRFQPKFPLEAGVTYRVVFRPSRLPAEPDPRDSDLVSTFRLPTPERQSTTLVTRIYPSANVLPENLLKFYVYFSAPMRRGHIYDHIHLLDAAGKPVELPFLEIDEELWNSELTRLTLIIDPGRIKRGVQPLEEVGPVLQASQSYTLVIDRAWQDAQGNPLKEACRKTFKAGPALRKPIDTASWQITAPQAGSVVPLRIRFPEPLDHALASRMIRVIETRGEIVQGETTLGEEEHLWSFVPTKPWTPGQYHIAVQTTIEDLAGNNIGKSFDVDLFERSERISNTAVLLGFEAK